MKKKSLKMIIMLNLVLTLMFITSTDVNASNHHLKEINAYLNHEIRIKIDNETFIPKDEDGTELIPITYEGRTYLPLRSIAEYLNVKVDWSGGSNEIHLDSSNMIRGSLKNYEYDPNPKSTLVKLEPISAHESRRTRHYVNGKPKSDDIDIDGNFSSITKFLPPIIYNNRIYFPIRVLGNSLDITVKWDDSSKTIYLGELPKGIIEKGLTFNETKLPRDVNNKFSYSTHQVIIEPHQHEVDYGLVMSGKNGVHPEIILNLNSEFNRVEFKLYIDVSFTDTYVLVYYDGKLHDTLDIQDLRHIMLPNGDVKWTTDHMYEYLDVRGVNELKFTPVYNTTIHPSSGNIIDGSHNHVILGDIIFK